MTSTDTFVFLFVVFFVGHHLGDYWVQTHHQACTKGKPGAEGRLACLRHVWGVTATKVVVLVVATVVTGADTSPVFLPIAMAVDAASHYWADRRVTLEGLAGHLAFMGKDQFYRLGSPRPDHDDNMTLGTGAAHLDQSWHIGWLFIAALIGSI